MGQSDFIFENGKSITVGSHGEHSYTFADGKAVADNGVSDFVFESGTGLGGWVEMSPMSTARYAFGCAHYDGVIYVTGGVNKKSCEQYDVSTDTWSSYTTLPQTVDSHGCFYFGTVYTAVGAFDDDADPYTYEETGGSWTRRTDAPTPRDEVRAGVANDIAYIPSGEDQNSDADNLYVNEGYDIAADTWSSYAQIPTSVRSYCLGVLNSNIYVIGGDTVPASETQDLTSAVQVYDTDTDSWSTAASYPFPVFSAAAASDRSYIYVAGGGKDTQDNIVGDTYKYDPSTDSWSKLASLQTPRRAFRLQYSNGYIYAIGGYDNNGNALASVERLAV